MELRCVRPESVEGKMKWTVNDQDPTDTVRYYVSTDGGTLIVNNATEKDNGESHIIYLCPINNIMSKGTV